MRLTYGDHLNLHESFQLRVVSRDTVCRFAGNHVGGTRCRVRSLLTPVLPDMTDALTAVMADQIEQQSRMEF